MQTDLSLCQSVHMSTGRPERCLSSADCLPRWNSANRLYTVACDGALFLELPACLLKSHSQLILSDTNTHDAFIVLFHFYVAIVSKE